MDIDFPLILSWAVIISGLIWLGDTLFLKPGREAAALAHEKKHGEGSGDALRRESLLVEYAHSFFPVLALVLMLRSFLVEPYQIPSESMVPTLEIGDFILVNKFAYGIRLPVLGTKVVDIGAPERGDVMVFVPLHDPKYFIKRVIGLPGDRIQYRNKQLTINGEPVKRQFVREFEERMASRRIRVREYEEQLGEALHPIYTYNTLEPGREWVVPEGHYFMMGDNRGKSFDSRSWGDIYPDRPELSFVPDSAIVGKAFAIWMHMPGWSIPSFERNQRIR
ncbi:MAG: signal peptidase I [Pseudomonadota bacterium]